MAASLTRRLLGHHAWLAVAFGLLSAGVAWHWNTRTAGGSDAYGYVSQAELWLRGDLRIAQPFAADVPWPHGDWTFTPLGYRPTADGHFIVPTYSPGLPLMMAAAAAVGGQCALFLVVPIVTGVLVWSTYAIGRQIGRPHVGLAAAGLVATSPAVLYMSVWQMSDVPAAAAWAVAIALLLSQRAPAALAAGLAAGLAVLIRPNLVALAGVLAAWIVWRDIAAGRWRDLRRAPAPWFVLGAGLGVIVVMMVYAAMYGSPFRSGYGSLSSKFAARWIPRNFSNYAGWVVGTETPLAAIGLASLVLPSARLWSTLRARQALWLFAGCVAAVWASYLAYETYPEWWYLRFLLPSWPLMAIGTASVIAAVYRRVPAWSRVAVASVLMVVGVHGVRTAAERGVFGLAGGESVYVEAARALEAFAEPGDVIVSGQFSGSVRYYSGHLTFRYGYLDPAWLDRAVQWFQDRGHHVYFLLTREEVWQLRMDYAPQSRLARLDWPALILLRDGEVRLFDAEPRDLAPDRPTYPMMSQAPCLRAKPFPTLRTVPRPR